MRAMLVVNPMATATSVRERDVLARALGSDLKLDLVETQSRGHAIELGRRAVEQRLDLVVVLGGDGTVNEVVNGLLTDGPAAELPTLAVVPGGSTNVFSRSLGISRRPVEATSDLLDALRTGRSRRIGLGCVNDRWFTFTAGLGLDAEAVRRVESARAAGNNASPSRYLRATLRSYLAMDRRHPTITLERPGEEPIDGLLFAIIANTSPWTYFRHHPIVLTRDGSFDSGLDLVALRRGNPFAVGWAASGMVTRSGVRGRSNRFHDLTGFTLRSERPMPLQVDGDWLGDATSLQVRSVAGALRVVA